MSNPLQCFDSVHFNVWLGTSIISVLNQDFKKFCLEADKLHCVVFSFNGSEHDFDVLQIFVCGGGCGCDVLDDLISLCVL